MRATLCALTLFVAACAGEVGSDARGYDAPIEDDVAEKDAAPVRPVGASSILLVINEVAASGEPEDWFELRNNGDVEVSLAGFSYTDDFAGNPAGAPFPEGAVVPAGGYFVQEVTREESGFKLGKDEALWLLYTDGAIVDTVDWGEGESPESGSFARQPDGDGEFAIAFPPTRGVANSL